MDLRTLNPELSERIAECMRRHGIPDDAPVGALIRILRAEHATLSPAAQADLEETKSDLVWILVGRPKDLHGARLGNSHARPDPIACQPALRDAEDRVEGFVESVRTALS